MERAELKSSRMLQYVERTPEVTCSPEVQILIKAEPLLDAKQTHTFGGLSCADLSCSGMS